MKERWLRIESTGFSPDEFARLIDASEETVARWIAGTTSLEESDILETALSVVELRLTAA